MLISSARNRIQALRRTAGPSARSTGIGKMASREVELRSQFLIMFMSDCLKRLLREAPTSDDVVRQGTLYCLVPLSGCKTKLPVSLDERLV